MTTEKNQKIRETYAATKKRRERQAVRVFSVKIQENKLNTAQREKLKMDFVEAKWLYNHVLALSKGQDVFGLKYNDIEEVTHYDKDGNEIHSRLLNLSSQMQQDVLKGICTSIRALSRLKKDAGRKAGALRFISEYRAINLKQPNVSYKVISRNRVKIQGIKKPLKVNGLRQILALPEYELANAKLLHTVDGYFINFTVYVPKEEKKDKPLMGIDMGCQTALTLSNGRKISCVVEETERIKSLKRKASRMEKGSNNSRKMWLRINRSMERLSRKREDKASKVCHSLKEYRVVMQDEQIHNWSMTGHGKKVQYSILGRVKARLMQREDTVILSKWIPTTRFCERCGNKYDISQSERTFHCPNCGNECDRDVHSARLMVWFYKNIKGVERTLYNISDFQNSVDGYFGNHNSEMLGKEDVSSWSHINEQKMKPTSL